MAYSQDTITDVNAANVLVGILDGLLTAEGWETVETITPSGTFRNRIYRSPGTLNLCGYDWYLAVSWNTVGTEQYVRILGAEAYDSGSKILSRICGAPFVPTSTSIKVCQPVDGRMISATLNLASSVVSASVTNFSTVNGSSSSTSQHNPGFQTIIPSSAFGYWASVTLDHVALWTTVAANSKDAVISSVIVDADYPFQQTPIIAFSDDAFEMSSAVIGVANTTSKWVGVHANFSGVIGARLPALSNAYDDAYAWQPYIYLDYFGEGSGNPPTLNAMNGGVTVGRVPDFLLVWGGAVGDTVEVDAATYVLTGPFGSSGNGYPTAALLVE